APPRRATPSLMAPRTRVDEPALARAGDLPLIDEDPLLPDPHPVKLGPVREHARGEPRHELRVAPRDPIGRVPHALHAPVLEQLGVGGMLGIASAIEHRPRAPHVALDREPEPLARADLEQRPALTEPEVARQPRYRPEQHLLHRPQHGDVPPLPRALVTR